MATKDDVLNTLRASGVVAVIRTETPTDLAAVARALATGGVRFIEITMTVPGALDIIGETAPELAGEGIFVGAGTVLDAPTARSVIEAGASYVVSPVLDEATVQLCNDKGVAVTASSRPP